VKTVVLSAFAVNGALVLAVVYSYGRAIKAENQRQGSDQVVVVDAIRRSRNRQHWKQVNRQAMAADLRLQSWLLRGLQMIVVGVGITVVALGVGSSDSASQAIAVAGQVVLASGLILLIAWSRLLGTQLKVLSKP